MARARGSRIALVGSWRTGLLLGTNITPERQASGGPCPVTSFLRTRQRRRKNPFRGFATVSSIVAVAGQPGVAALGRLCLSLSR